MRTHLEQKTTQYHNSMKRFFFLHFIALFCLCANAQTTLGWGSIDVRYSQTEVPETSQKSPLLRAWRGERVAAQAVLTTQEELKSVDFTVSDLKSGRHIIPASAVKKYFMRYVITSTFKNKRDSILVADRLEPAATCHMEKGTTQPLWLDIQVPAEAVPGTYKGSVIVNCDGKKLSLPLQLQVADRVLPEPGKWSFHLDLWQNPYAVARYFDVPLWSSQHFDKMRPIMQMLAAAGQKVITCSVINRPWNGQTFDHFESMIAKMKQIDGTWKYDYTVFDRWVEFMMLCGITEQIDCYTLVPWHYRFDYYDCATNSVKHLDCRPGEAKYHDFIVPFLKDFSRHLRQKGWFERTYIAMDERPEDQMESAWQTIQDADPEFKIEGAANYSVDSEAADRVDDISVGFQYNLLNEEALARRTAKGQKTNFYTCCNPERPNTFTFSPPAESAYLGLHAAACNYDGYLRWAYNSWTKEPNKDTRYGNWPAGDCYLVYPEGSSIRFERLVEGIQTYEKIRLLRPSLNPKESQRLDEMLQNFAPNTYEADKNTVTLLKEMNDLLWKFSR
ncbi:MAG: DUF4091 domain-containing protein [Bacteroidaceae bacterium]|nr:DUF4091 domain-containing protein [Bacteroidaceae bacterium]